jgi:hypothetical protein
MISRCILSEGRGGTLVHTVIRLDAGGTLVASEHEYATISSPLDYRVIVYKCFWSHMKRRGITSFHQSVLFREDPCVKMMFKAPAIYKRALDEMCLFLILTKSAKLYKLGTQP